MKVKIVKPVREEKEDPDMTLFKTDLLICNRRLYFESIGSVFGDQHIHARLIKVHRERMARLGF